VVYLSSSKQIPGQYFDLANTASFQIFQTSTSINHPAIPYSVLQTLRAFWSSPPPPVMSCPLKAATPDTDYAWSLTSLPLVYHSGVVSMQNLLYARRVIWSYTYFAELTPVDVSIIAYTEVNQRSLKDPHLSRIVTLPPPVQSSIFTFYHAAIILA
jgi:hypothetical protein